MALHVYYGSVDFAIDEDQISAAEAVALIDQTLLDGRIWCKLPTKGGDVQLRLRPDSHVAVKSSKDSGRRLGIIGD